MATRKYSTGPLPNGFAQSNVVTVQILNNGKSLVTARVRAFRLDGALGGAPKTRFFSRTIAVSSNSSSFLTFGVEEIEQFEVQIKVRNGDNSVSKVLVSVFGSKLGVLNPSHRVVHRELKRI